MSAHRIILAGLLALSCLISSGKGNGHGKRFTCGAEWNYVMTLQSGFHYNYFSTEGFRVDERGNDFLYYSNGDVYFHAGYDLDERWNLSMYLGYAGVHNIHAVIPVSIRGTRYFNPNPMGDRWFAFTDLGSGICVKEQPQEILVARLGGGYSLALSRFTRLEFICSARITYTHPQVYDQGDVIRLNKTNRNNAYVSALSLGLGITF
jgi:hypothetical protein